MQDWRLALRLLSKDKSFTLTAVLTLAVCIGANVALFSIVDHVVLRPLPFPDSERILLMANQYPGAGVRVSNSSGVPDYFDRLRETAVFEALALYNGGTVSMEQEGVPTRLRVMNVTPSFFRLLQVPPQLGRHFTDAEGELGSEKKVVLSYGLWHSVFAGDAGAIGRDIRLDGQPFTIVGVMPRGFTFVDDDVMLWRPLAFTPQQKSDDERHSNSWRNIGRLKPGADVRQAQQQIDALNARNLDRFPKYKQVLLNARFHTSVVRLQDDLVRDVKPSLYLLWGGALFVLLIGCVNVANLVLVRTSARLRELVTRLALGASRWRIARQLVTESMVLTAVGAGAGLLVGFAALRLLAALNIQDLPRGHEIRIDGAVGAYTVAIVAAIGIILGLIPVVSLSGVNLAAVLSEQGRGGTSGRRAQLLRRGFVVAQVAFAFVLLNGAGLLFASFRSVLAVDPGLVADHVLTASVVLPQVRYKDDPSLVQFTAETLRHLRILPGVTAAGATDTIPFGDRHSDSVILAEGYQMKPGESLISPDQVVVSPGFFEAIGAKLIRGRFFDQRDGADGPKAVIVDEKLAHRFWPDRDPIGRRMYRPTDINNLLAISDKTVFLTVVGVIHDIKLRNLVEGNGEVGAYYFPFDQNVRRGLTFAVRTSAGDPAALTRSLRTIINEMDRELPLFNVRMMSELVNRSLMTHRSPMLLSVIFGVVALFLSAVGMYGVLAYLVTQRTKEIGIRLALGSSAAAVFRLMLREGVWLMVGGFVLGAGGAMALGRSLESQLFGVQARDPIVLLLATLTLALVGLAASALPARRAATRIDPVIALAE